MLRRDGLKIIQEQITNEPVIANLGPSTFDLHSSGDRDANLYTWGAMGLEKIKDNKKDKEKK